MTRPSTAGSMSMEQYLAWEAGQPGRNTYVRGEVFALTGARQAHVAVTGNVYAALKTALRGGACRAFVSDMKLRVDAAAMVFYPDVMVSCDPQDRLTPLFISHPRLVVEVLSESTAAFDRGAKFAACRSLASLQEYALIDIPARRSEVFRRNAEGHWVLYEYMGSAAVEFASVGATLPAEVVFEDVEEDEGEEGEEGE